MKTYVHKQRVHTHAHGGQHVEAAPTSVLEIPEFLFIFLVCFVFRLSVSYCSVCFQVY